MLKKVGARKNSFSGKAMKTLLVHDLLHFKIFNFKARQELPIHNHDIDGQPNIVVLEGKGALLDKEDLSLPANPGDVSVSDISEPHGIRAIDDLRVLVTIAPPI